MAESKTMRFELHCHSSFSKGTKVPWEGTMRPEDVVRHAQRAGLDGVALTDHNTVAGLKAARREADRLGMIFVPGVETKSSDGHVIGLGIEEHVPVGKSAAETIECIRSRGGIAIAPHPFDVRREGVADSMGSGGLRSFDAVEIFNSLNVDRFANRRARHCATALGLNAVVGSDAHTQSMMGLSANVMKNAYDADDVMRRISRGRLSFEKRYVPVTEIVEWSRIRMVRSYDEVIRHINSNWPSPARLFGRFMLRRFVGSERTRLWNSVGYLCLAGVMLYSGMRSGRA